jgi:hypothetical protein
MIPIALPAFSSITAALRIAAGVCRPLICLIALVGVPSQLSANWVPAGPAPAINGQDEGITSPEGPNPVSGAVNGIAASATDANLLYVAAVNGGIWKTTNATAASPSWTPLTDQALPSLTVSWVAISPLDPQVIFVASGRVSSLAKTGGKEFGLARSTDGGANWTVVGTNLADITVERVVPTAILEGGSQVVLAATASGVFRSPDGGTTFTVVTDGIPAESIADLAADPGVPTRFYASSKVSGSIYRSDNAGATWVLAHGNGFTPVKNARVLLSVHNSPGNNVVYAAVLSNGTLANVYRSPDQGANWAPLGVPTPPLFPGSQGGIHGAFVADRTDPNTIWIAGDRQPDNTEIGGGPNQFPNPNGANDYSGNIFRNVAGAWQLMALNGANGSSPHADSRVMVFDAAGNLLHGCDGGIFKLNEPNLASRIWSSLNGNINITEVHSSSYDPVGKNFIIGAQDNGTSFQRQPGNFVWNNAASGDGGRVGVDADQAAHAGTSFRYYSSQNFSGFSRAAYDTMGNAVGNAAAVGLNITAGAGAGMTLKQFDTGVQFIQPFTLNAINPARMLIGTGNNAPGNIYESLDRGDSLTNLGSAGAAVGNGVETGSPPIAYGGRQNGNPFPDVFYVGAGNTIRHRVNAGDPIATLTYPGGTVRGIVMDPQNYTRVFVLDSANKVFGSPDAGANWTELTGNLGTLTDSVRCIELFNTSTTFEGAILYVGGANGVWQLPNPTAAGNWTAVGTGMPKTLVYALRYDYADNVLSAGTLGRGVFRLDPTVTPPAATAMVSRKVHGTAGTFDINFPLPTTAVTECRSGGAGGNYQVW